MPTLEQPVRLLYKRASATDATQATSEESVHEDWDSLVRQVSALTGSSEEESQQLAERLIDAEIVSIERGILEAKPAQIP